MTVPADIARFVLAGNATLTLKSCKTERWYTYRVQQGSDRQTGKPAPIWFVKVLTDGDKYVYLGMIGRDRAFGLTRKSRFSEAAPSVKAFCFFWSHLTQREAVAPDLEVRHHNHCGRGGRELTVPESVDRGIGPDCWEIMGRPGEPQLRLVG